MSRGLEPARPAGPLFRLGRRPDPWAWPEWANAAEDGTFGNRYDDPVGEFRVLYASSQRLGAFAETLARFRPDPAVLAAEIEGDPRDDDYPTAAPGMVPRGWCRSRELGSASLDASFADVGHGRSLASLREAMASELVRYGLDDLDGATIRLRAPRRFTQELSRYVYMCTSESGERAFQGIRYLSRLGDEIEDWAICEPAEGLQPLGSEAVDEGDPDLRAILARFNLELGRG